MLNPDVISICHEPGNENQVRLDLHVPIELDYFAGHFPNLPVLPGVVQIDWAVRYARAHFTLAGCFTALEHIKFQSLVLPDAKLQLLLKWDEQKKRLEFSFSTSERKYSSGRIAFGGAL
jgi:3-hydroxymyristoyl/3-hydroxydecanoyl-(acyl carrier protein) dehydratase